jgi:surface carbohydrate biosynthesis protein
MTGVVYIPIEKKSRELTPKLLVAGELAKRGFTTVLGFSRALFANILNFPPGVIYFKGMNRVQVAYMRRLAGSGHAIVATDEEALGARGLLLTKDTWHEAPSYVRTVFCQGAEQAQVLEKDLAFQPEQLKRTGNPRIDLLQPKFASAWKKESEALRRKYGRFILVNTDMSSVNSRHHDLEQYKQSLVQIGWLNPKSPADLVLMDEHIEHDRENLAAIGDFVRQMNQRHPDLPVIIRPHPGENPGHWRGLAETCANTIVVDGSEPIPWLLAAACLVQAGCTTGVEARVLGTPSISLIRNPCGAAFPDYRITNHVNPVAGDIATAIRMVVTIVAEKKPTADLAETRSALAPYIDIDEGRFAYEKIVDGIEDILKEMAEVQWDDIRPIDRDVDDALRQTVPKAAFEDGHSDEDEISVRIRSLWGEDENPIGCVRNLDWGLCALKARS